METSKYVIVSGSDRKELEKKVNEAIENGYQPIGGVTIDIHNAYHQAMKKNFWPDSGEYMDPAGKSGINK